MVSRLVRWTFGVELLGIVLLAFPLLLLPMTAASGDISYLKEMPDPARVLADIQGSDSLDTVAKQLGTLEQLRNMVMVMSDGRVNRNQLTAQEQQMVKAYVEAIKQLEVVPKFDEEETRRLGTNSPRAKWYAHRWHYDLDEALRNELFKRYFSPQVQARYLSIKNKEDQQVANYDSAQRARQNAERARARPEVEHATIWGLDPIFIFPLMIVGIMSGLAIAFVGTAWAISTTAGRIAQLLHIHHPMLLLILLLTVFLFVLYVGALVASRYM